MLRRQFLCLAIAIAVFSPLLVAQDAPRIPIEQMIRSFVSSEEEVQLVLAQYTYRRDLRFQELSPSDVVRGEYRVVSDISVDANGARHEQVLDNPKPTLQRVSITREDLEIMQRLASSLLASREVENYDIRSAGRENINGVQCEVLELNPKKSISGQLSFTGKVWIAEGDLKVVRINGRYKDIREKGRENLFPRFEMTRAQVDGHWLPSLLTATDTLQFSSGPVHIRWEVKYDNYRKK